MRTTATALALVLLAPAAALAQDAPPPPPPPAPAAEPMPAPAPAPAIVAPAPPPAPAAAAAPSGPVFEGLVDTYYMYKLTNVSNSLEGVTGRAFDVATNSFTLNYAKLAFGWNTDKIGVRVDMGYGHTGVIINSQNNSASFGSALYSSGFIVQQAYATAKLLDGMLTIDAGKFVTTAGAEVIESNKNWNYSRSFLFNGIPFLHTGVRANLKLNDQFTLQGSVVNGWNNDPDNNGPKTFGLNATFVANPMFTGYLTTYIGKEGNAGAEGDMRILVDAVGAITVNDMVAVNVNVDYLKQGSANWFGVSAMAKLAVSEAVYLAPRFEYIKSKNGYLIDGSLYEGTLTAGFPIQKNYEARAEFRFDGSDQAIFAGKEMKKQQMTGLVSALAFF